MQAVVMRVLGILINFVGIFAPALAGRLAFGIFTKTPSREPKSEKERAVVEAAKPVFAQAAQRTIALSQSAAVAHVFARPSGANGPRILLTHGWASSAIYMHGLIAGLRDYGAEVVALDLPGHGAAPGKRLHAPLAVEAIARTCEELGPFDIMIGHSFGGYMTVLATYGVLPNLFKPNPQKVVTIASPSDVRVVFGFFGAMLGLSRTVQKAMAKHVESLSGRTLAQFFGPTLLAESNVPALVLHAEDDKEVGAKAARQYADAGHNISLQWLNGLGHRRIVNAPQTLAAITEFAA